MQDIIKEEAYIPLNLDAGNTSIRVGCLIEILLKVKNSIRIIELKNKKKTKWSN